MKFFRVVHLNLKYPNQLAYPVLYESCFQLAKYSACHISPTYSFYRQACMQLQTNRQSCSGTRLLTLRPWSGLQLKPHSLLLRVSMDKFGSSAVLATHNLALSRPRLQLSALVCSTAASRRRLGQSWSNMLVIERLAGLGSVNIIWLVLGGAWNLQGPSSENDQPTCFRFITFSVSSPAYSSSNVKRSRYSTDPSAMVRSRTLPN